jgi:RNA polymerase sigma-70 factor, ECF subfamily
VHFRGEQYGIMTDQQLVKAILTGDNNAMRDLIVKYQDFVLNTCFKVLRSREDAEDIAQEVFIETYRSVATLRNEESISFWLYRVSLNKSINYSKRKKNSGFCLLLHIDSLFNHDGEENEIEIPLSEDDPGQGLENKERLEILYKAVSTLPALQQKAFILHHYENLSYKEISKVLGVSLSSIESLLFRAKVNLQKKCSFYNLSAQKKHKKK